MNFPPFIFEADLYAAVNDKTSTAVVGDGAVVFTLNKLEALIWGQLTAAGYALLIVVTGHVKYSVLTMINYQR